MNPKIISVQQLRLGFNKHDIIQDANFAISKGEFIGIFGANGSGKSTFIKALLGLLAPRSGKILVLDEPPQHGNPAIGYMPQLRNSRCNANLTAMTMLEASANIHYGLPFLSPRKKIEVQSVLELVQATAFAHRPFQQLSGGERQRIYLAQALLGQPQLLLLDEPLAGLDPHYQETFINLLQHIQNTLQVTILFTAHDPNPLLNVMDRVLYFANGHAVIGTVDEVITSEKLSALYNTTIEVIHYKNRLIVLGEENNIIEQDAHHG